MTEKVTETAPNIDVVAETEKVIHKVSNMNIETMLNEWIIPYGTKILLAIAIFVVGKFLARLISRLLGKAALKSTKDEMLQSFIVSISYFLLLLIVVIASLSQIGINTSSLVALIGAAGLAIGLSLQNSLQNFAAGVMLLIFKPFRKGDLIETGGMTGVVEQMGLLVLELRTGDNKTVLLPNGKVFSDSIINYSNNPTRRIDFTFDISYESNLKEAKEIIQRILDANTYVLKDPAPVVAVGALAPHSVQLVVRPWVQTPNYWAAYWEIIEQVKLAFGEAGISIPYNQMELHIKSGSLENKA
ncbi:TPA: mechanosensitive ion channel [Mannheimia haemolytica]|uniref:Small-conductance mechanosensitive channel n=1 Tax=Mannheimia haemolytica TaxID=75985 RepID=A0A248ZX46_MANHA|nr:mechanosensitive ion channel domain-containing protein [Mannheimia haemolytica]AWW70542.1 mechanosensitive ion channel protein MscS [Pasteurellaceae bacterium 12565]AGI31599.1 mechanosensitive ion channel protein MscS [Mannheimia haemolytica USDA-ARS-USMARC-183]AGI36292.1 mechanosensitive ion channel protein MscS [Mannheimia haemolytica USDA-ARS-USMARC-185]AGK00760.1 mechanosensitive channel MscS [Mannheimia haemolytica M42548]AGQ25614.1 mechanosensitive ion channel protein [Mannheimia haem